MERPLPASSMPRVTSVPSHFQRIVLVIAMIEHRVTSAFISVNPFTERPFSSRQSWPNGVNLNTAVTRNRWQTAPIEIEQEPQWV